MAAISAIDRARRYAWRLDKEAKEARDREGRRQATLEEAWGLRPPLPTPVERAARAAAAEFWGHLAEFASVGPVAWPVAEGAPFLAPAGPESGQLVLHMPQ